MSEKRFRVNDLVKYVYSDIGEYVDEKYTDTPLRNDEVCKILNEQQAIIDEQKIAIDEMITDYKKLEKENEWLRQFINKGRRLSVKELMDNINENEKLKKVIDLMEYQMKVQDRIIKEYEDGESNEL